MTVGLKRAPLARFHQARIRAAMSAVLIVLLFLLIAINAVFVAAEFALVRSRRSKLETARQ